VDVESGKNQARWWIVMERMVRRMPSKLERHEGTEDRHLPGDDRCLELLSTEVTPNPTAKMRIAAKQS
jgi:hypothetical protein